MNRRLCTPGIIMGFMLYITMLVGVVAVLYGAFSTDFQLFQVTFPQAGEHP